MEFDENAMTPSEHAKQGRQREYDELFKRVLESMNAGRWQPIPPSEYSLIAEVCAEAVDLGWRLNGSEER